MIPVPSIWTRVVGPTMTWAPPMNALMVITTSWAANFACRRSSSAPPIRHRIVICLGTTQTPLRLSPLRIARWLSLSAPGTTWGDATAGRTTGGAGGGGGRGGGGGTRAGGARQVEGDRHQVGVGAGGVGLLQPLVELVDVEPALPRGLAKDLGDLVTLLVGDAQLRRIGAPARLLQLARHGHIVCRTVSPPRRGRGPGRP